MEDLDLNNLTDDELLETLASLEGILDGLDDEGDNYEKK